MADSKEKLFSDFSPVSTEQWMEKVTADLKGADFEKKLVWRTNEGFKVKPFYRMEDLEGLKTTDALPGEFPYLRGTKKDNNEWLVRQEIKVECPVCHSQHRIYGSKLALQHRRPDLHRPRRWIS